MANDRSAFSGARDKKAMQQGMRQGMQQETQGMTSPHSIEAEQAVLGGVLKIFIPMVTA